jgi:hypothetical protein
VENFITKKRSKERMTDQKRIMELVEILGSDATQRENATNELRCSQEGETYTEIYRIFAAMGDDIFTAEGAAGIGQEILKAMKSGAKKSRQWATEEVHTLSVDALTRWGVEVPPVTEQAVHICHVCGIKITEERVMVCGLHSCDNDVCREHSHIIETRFGQFDGSGGAWFCTDEHYQHANHNHVDWN